MPGTWRVAMAICATGAEWAPESTWFFRPLVQVVQAILRRTVKGFAQDRKRFSTNATLQGARPFVFAVRAAAIAVIAATEAGNAVIKFSGDLDRKNRQKLVPSLQFTVVPEHGSSG